MLPTVEVDGTNDENSVVPVAEVYHFKDDPVAVTSSDTVSPLQYCIGEVTVGASGTAFTAIVAVPASLSQPY